MLTLSYADETLELWPDRLLHWPRERTLMLADPHFGKSAAFRSAGIPVPGGATQRDLARLSSAMRACAARRLVILGDFFHARSGRDAETLALLAAWRAEWADVDMLLVRGNHDAHAGAPPAAWDVRTVDAPHVAGPFALCHYPEPSDAGFVLAGHLHPAVQLVGRGDGVLKAPCFWFRPRIATLPAFGSFTGTHRVRPRAGDRVFVLGDGAVVEAPLA